MLFFMRLSFLSRPLILLINLNVGNLPLLPPLLFSLNISYPYTTMIPLPHPKPYLIRPTLPLLHQSSPSPAQTSSPSDPPPPPPRHSTRISKPPHHLQDYICNVASSSTSSYPLHHYLSYSNHRAYTLAIDIIPEPASYAEASKHDCWVEAMKRELNVLAANHTWLIVDKPASIIPRGCKWVFKVKRKADGTLERYKARLVAKGYTQTEGVDFFDTFSPVAKMATVRLLIALAAIKGWHIHQLDVNNAFLHGELKEEVYMSIAPGVDNAGPHKVCKLLKSLYGLKQANCKWYERLTILLLDLGYKQAHADHSLFTHITPSSYTALLIYVDDIVLVGDSLQEITKIKQTLDHHFGIKDLGLLKFFLGIEVAHSTTGISLCQRHYCLKLLDDSGTLGSKPASTPMEPGSHLHQDDGPLFPDVLSYRRLVGRLLYLTTTRPDICFAVQQLSQFLSKPTVSHFKAAQRVLHYLKSAPGQGLFFSRSSSLSLQGYSHSD